MAKVNYKGIADAKEPELLPDGLKNLRILKAEYKEGKVEGKHHTLVIIDCPERPDCQSIFFYLGDPMGFEEYMSFNPDKSKEDWDKAEAFKSLNAKRFMVHFDIPWDEDGYDTDDFAGKTADTITQQSESEYEGKKRKQVDMILPELPNL